MNRNKILTKLYFQNFNNINLVFFSENNNTILSPQMAVQSKSSSSRSKAPAQPRSRFGLSSIARLANPLLRGEDDSEWGLNSGSFKSPSTPGGRSVGASGSQRVYRRKSKSTKHNILEEVTDHARAQLMTDIRNSKQAKRVSIRKLVTEPLASERVQFLNQASSSSSKSNNGGTIYLQESAKALTSCPETMMGYLCQREANKVLWKKYFVVLDSGTFSIFKLKKAPPVQPPYGDQVVKTMALKTYTVSLTDKSIKDDNGEVIPLKLYLKNNKSSGAKEDEEMVFRSLDSNTNDITLEEWADAFNAHILYDSQATKKKSSFLSLLE